MFENTLCDSAASVSICCCVSKTKTRASTSYESSINVWTYMPRFNYCIVFVVCEKASKMRKTTSCIFAYFGSTTTTFSNTSANSWIEAINDFFISFVIRRLKSNALAGYFRLAGTITIFPNPSVRSVKFVSIDWMNSTLLNSGFYCIDSSSFKCAELVSNAELA